MTDKRHHPQPFYTRTSLPLKGTLARAQAHLDLRSVVALEYAQEAHRRAGRLKVSPSAVLRRALAVYIRHLSTAQPRAEFMALAFASKTLNHEEPEKAHRMALLRLYAVPDHEPMPPFEVVLDGPRVVADRATLHQRLENVLEALE